MASGRYIDHAAPKGQALDGRARIQALKRDDSSTSPGIWMPFSTRRQHGLTAIVAAGRGANG